MAKRNSTKTATKEAMQASEPKVQVLRQWAGININEAPLNWDIDSETEQTDLNAKQLLVQNNVDTTTTGCLEARAKEYLLADAPRGYLFTGVTYMKGRFVYAAFQPESGGGEVIMRHSVLDISVEPDEGASIWESIPHSVSGSAISMKWTEIYSFINDGVEHLIALGESSSGSCMMFSGRLLETSMSITGTNGISDPTAACTKNLVGIAESQTDYVSVINFTYSYSNMYGSTRPSTGYTTVYSTTAIANFTYSKFITLSGTAPAGVTGVDLYCSTNESTNLIFIGHVTLDNGGAWKYAWYGALANTDEWTNANLYANQDNTTKGPDARYCRQIDGRMYFWGSKTKPDRLYIGGHSGHEFCIAQGSGGAYVDAEPGHGHIINSVLKWKTASGGSIVTVLCGNENSSQSTRFNLLENTITVSSELVTKSYLLEQVANTVGCQSRWGAGVWIDGLYVLHRYGLTLTTHTMEYNSQVQSQIISDNIEPIFTDRMGSYIDNARMICIKDRVFIVFGTETDDKLDNVIICYDIGLKAFYTYTYGNDDTSILHVMNIDYKDQIEGIGVVTPDHMSIIPTTGVREYTDEDNVDIMIETGELGASIPNQSTTYVAQVEIRFDYFVGNVNVDLEGVDYYGRHIKIHKHISSHTMKNDYTDWIRVNCYLENYNLTFTGTAQFRLTHMLVKQYTTSNKIGLSRGFDSRSSYFDRQNAVVEIRHYIRDYANLRECIMP